MGKRRYRKLQRRHPEWKEKPIKISTGNPGNMTWEEIINKYNNGSPCTIFGKIIT